MVRSGTIPSLELKADHIEAYMKSFNTKERAALIIIDVQKGLDDWNYYGGNRNNPDAEINMKKILDFWRKHLLPVIHIKHNSTNPQSPLVKGKPGNAIKKEVYPIDGEPVFEKTVNSAFIGTGLQDHLKKNNISQLIIVGLTTDHCISTSVRMAANLGFSVLLVSDATATFDGTGPKGQKYPADLMHETALASLNIEFASILTTDEVLKAR